MSGPKTRNLTKWDFNKVDCRTKCGILVENSKTLLLIGSPIGSGGGDKERAREDLHLAFICELHETQLHGVGISFRHTHSLQTVGNRQQLWMS